MRQITLSQSRPLSYLSCRAIDVHSDTLPIKNARAFSFQTREFGKGARDGEPILVTAGFEISANQLNVCE